MVLDPLDDFPLRPPAGIGGKRRGWGKEEEVEMKLLTVYSCSPEFKAAKYLAFSMYTKCLCLRIKQ